MQENSNYSSPPKVNLLKNLFQVFSTGFALAILFNTFTPLGVLPTGLTSANPVFSPFDTNLEGDVPIPTPFPQSHIGIVAGHWEFDTGAICPDGLTEQEVNLAIATLTKEYLINEGFTVDIFGEYDDRLDGFRGLALVSIHADSCEFVDTNATGYKVAAPQDSLQSAKSQRLSSCIASRYQEYSHLNYHPGSVTRDMTENHAFDKINPQTPATIIETGFLNLDKIFLTTKPEIAAQGIAEGILCFIHNENASPPTASENN
jgi:N-acetylmuramoyl-L-alanine amidase